MKHRRVPAAVMVAAVFVVISFQSKPSDTSIPDPHQIPGAIDDDTSLREIAAWVAQDRSRAPRLQALSIGDLDAALTTSEPRRFALFERDLDDKARRRVLERLPYGSAIWAASRRHHVDGLLVAAIVQAESRFVPEAVSPQGAIGLMQVMPATGGFRSVAPAPTPAPAPVMTTVTIPVMPTAATSVLSPAMSPEAAPAPTPAPEMATEAPAQPKAAPAPRPSRSHPLFDPYVNLDTGSRYLRRLLREFDGDLELALAAYNAGPGAVERYGGIPPFRETREYVRRVLAIYQEHYERAWQGSEAAKDAMSLFGSSR